MISARPVGRDSPGGVLLDSNALLWLTDTSAGRLGPTAKEAIQRADRVFFSAASVWELTIKAAKGRLVLPADLVAGLVRFGLQELPVCAVHSEAISRVALDRADPFDRLIVAQAWHEGMPLVTSDQRILASEATITIDASR